MCVFQPQNSLFLPGSLPEQTHPRSTGAALLHSLCGETAALWLLFLSCSCDALQVNSFDTRFVQLYLVDTMGWSNGKGKGSWNQDQGKDLEDPVEKKEDHLLQDMHTACSTKKERSFAKFKKACVGKKKKKNDKKSCPY